MDVGTGQQASPITEITGMATVRGTPAKSGQVINDGDFFLVIMGFLIIIRFHKSHSSFSKCFAPTRLYPAAHVAAGFIFYYWTRGRFHR